VKLTDLATKVDESNLPSETREGILDVLAFVEAIHETMKENGMVPINQDVDLNSLEGLIDAILGELGACAIFLSDKHFPDTPKMLRVVGDGLAKMEDSPIPAPIQKGFYRLAKRIEVTREERIRKETTTSNEQSEVSDLPDVP
jgi:hypothetical protein